MRFLFLLILLCYVKLHINFKTWKCPIFEKLEGLCDKYSKKSDKIKLDFITNIQSNIMVLFSVPINTKHSNKLLFNVFVRILKDFIINNPTDNFFHCRLKGKKITENSVFIDTLHLIQSTYYMKNFNKNENGIFQFKKEMELECTRKQFDIDSTFFDKQIKSDVAFMLFDTCMTNENYFELLCNFVYLSLNRVNLPIKHVYIIFVLKLPDSFKKSNWLDLYFDNYDDITFKEKNHHRPFLHSLEYIYEPKQDYDISIKNFTIYKRYIYKLNNVLVSKSASDEDFARFKINVAKFLIFTIDVIQVKLNKCYFDCNQSNRKNFLAEKLYKIEILAFQISYKIFICTTLHRMNSLVNDKNHHKYLGCITIYSLRNFKSIVHLRCYYIFRIGEDMDNLDVIQEQNLKNKGLKYQQNRYNNFINEFKCLLDNYSFKKFKYMNLLNNFIMYNQFNLVNQFLLDGKIKASNEIIHKFCLAIITKFKATKYNNDFLECRMYNMTVNLGKWKIQANVTRYKFFTCLELLHEIDESELTQELIMNYRTVVINLSYRNNNEQIQYYFFIPIKERFLYQNLIVSHDVPVKNVNDLLNQTLPTEQMKHKNFLSMVLSDFFMTETQISTTQLLQFGIQNFSNIDVEINRLMMKHLTHIPKFNNIVAFNSKGLKMDMLEITKTFFGVKYDFRNSKTLMEYFLQDEEIVILRKYIIKQIETLHIKYLKNEYAIENLEEYPFLIFDDSLSSVNTLRLTITEVLQEFYFSY